ncbi:DNA cytosine methyltransferase [Brucella endophytica]|uniref:DNA cytosine methyltransferase n=1 Tax=Brucella endophytica TaxID=1963359 RepID=UPI00166DC5F3|nr:DNA cytosine methyltransferase [Brucella endophytica]
MNVALRPEHLNILSLCTGGAGLDLGVELAIPSARTVCMVEREAFAVAHLVSAMEQGLMAPAPIWSNARTFEGRRWRGTVDGLIGGIPCQPHSLAGRKGGQHDERDLWTDARRIVVQSRPWFVLIENVTGMLSPGDDEIAGAERVWRDLRKLGFAVEGGLFTAAEVGASHERERIFILGVADAGDPRPQRREQFQPLGERNGKEASRSVAKLCGAPLVYAQCPEWRADACGGYQPDWDHIERNQAASGAGEPSPMVGDTYLIGECQSDDADSAIPRQDAWFGIGGTSVGLFPPGPSDSENWQSILERAPELEPAFRRVADGLASRLDIGRVDRLRMLGNGVVPLQAAYAVRVLAIRLAARGCTGAASLVRMMEDHS